MAEKFFHQLEIQELRLGSMIVRVEPLAPDTVHETVTKVNIIDGRNEYQATFSEKALSAFIAALFNAQALAERAKHVWPAPAKKTPPPTPPPPVEKKCLCLSANTPGTPHKPGCPRCGIDPCPKCGGAFGNPPIPHDPRCEFAVMKP